MLSKNKRKRFVRGEYHKQKPEEITPQRLKNIALNYLKRFEATEATLRTMLQRRVSLYAFYDKEFDKKKALEWVEQIVAEFVQRQYVDDARFAEIKIRHGIESGKSPRYILNRLREKGVDDDMAEQILAKQDYDPFAAALQLTKKRKIGPYSQDAEIRKNRRDKDLAVLVRAGFDYDLALKVLDFVPEEENP